METETKNSTNSDSSGKKLFALGVAIGVSVLVAILIPDYASDFTCFYQAGSAIVSFQSPYSAECYYSPVWVALLFSPLSVFTRDIAYRIYAAILFVSYIFIIWKISKQRLHISLIASFSPFVYMTMQYGNIDWLVLLGLISPKIIGIWLITTKPQMGFTLAILWGWRIFKERGAKSLFITFAPVTLGLIVSFLLGMRLPNPENLSAWSADIWPFGLLLGIPFLVIAIQKKDDYLALATAPLLAPYFGPMSWAAILPVAMRSRKYITVALVFSWFLIIIWRSQI
jgi:hypothetical protein